ncbi:site-specific integrase [Chitinophaga sp. CC14]|uniref:site-specific integrase n=1 Tax=Chitinophaga sp. CC14 TaxID=3029199 RepID=UPI003B81D66F
MSDQNSLGIDFVVRKLKSDKRLACLFARVTVNGEETEISLKEKVIHSKWNNKGKFLEGKPNEVALTNDFINNSRARIKAAYRALEETMIPFTAEEVKEFFLGKHFSQINKDHTVLKLIKKHETECLPHLEKGTTKNYVATETYVKNFIFHKYKKEDILVHYLDFVFITEFENYIPSHPIKAHDPCTENGTAKHIERFKKIVKWGKDLGWLKSEPFKGFTATTRKKKRAKLKLHQLVALEKYLFANNDLRYARDLFVFSCYTGFAFADVMALTTYYFSISSKDRIWCTKYREKSQELAAVPIHPIAAFLIQKYMNTPKAIAAGRIFPPISNQHINRLLKVIQEILGITIKFTFHLARHTFATVIALQNGIPLVVAAKMMGIKKLDTMLVYGEVDEELMEKELDKADEKLNSRKKLLPPMEKIATYQNLPTGMQLHPLVPVPNLADKIELEGAAINKESKNIAPKREKKAANLLT